MRKSLFWFLILVISISMVLTFLLAGCKTTSAAETTAAGETAIAETTEAATEAVETTAAAVEAAETTAADQKPDIKIGTMTMGFHQPYFVALSQGYKDLAKEFERANVEVIEIDPKGDAAKQVSGIENMISLGVDGMIITAIDPPVIATEVEKAMQNNIKIISHYNKLSAQDLLSGVSNYGMGYVAGQVAAGWINEQYKDKEIEVALLVWDKTEFDIERTKGMKDALALLAPDAKIVAEQAADAIESGLNVTASILQANPNVKVFVAYNDEGGLGALAAVEEAGLSGEEIGIFGVNASPEALTKIKAGTAFKGTASIDPYNHGRLEMEMALRLILGDFVPSSMEIYPVPVTQKNVDQFIK